jgi:uncharacterized membrane protein
VSADEFIIDVVVAVVVALGWLVIIYGGLKALWPDSWGK